MEIIEVDIIYWDKIKAYSYIILNLITSESVSPFMKVPKKWTKTEESYVVS